jgi:hypothetical protein
MTILGLGLGLPFVRSSGAAAPFTPASLFGVGDQGAWFDSTDLNSMLQTTASTLIPVTAVEQPVGFIADKSKQQTWLDDTGGTWAKFSGDGVVTVVGNVITITGATTVTSVRRSGGVTGNGQLYITVNADTSTCTSPLLYCRLSPIAIANNVDSSSCQTIQSGTSDAIQISTGSITVTVKAVKYWLGNHATQATAAARPTLSAKYNVLTRTEELDHADWTKVNCTVVANNGLNPSGVMLADKIVEGVGNPTDTVRGFRIRNTAGAMSTNASTNIVTFYAEAAGRTQLSVGGEAATIITLLGIDLTTNASLGYVCATGVGNVSVTFISCVDVVGNIKKITVRVTNVTKANGYNLVFGLVNGGTLNYVGDGVSGVNIWGADCRVENDAINLPAYQKVAAITAYDLPGFPLYLKTDGVDDGYATGNIDFSATDKITTFTGLRKLTDAASGTVVELSATGLTNNGSFYLAAPGTAAANYQIGTRGATNVTGNVISSYTAPISNVITTQHDTAQTTFGAQNVGRVNGAAPGGSAGAGAQPIGATNFGAAYPLYIGRRGGTSIPFNGRLHQLVVLGRLATAQEITNTENYINAKAQMY